MSEIETLAKGLTEAQRAAIKGARYSFHWLVVSGSPATLHALKRRGVTKGLSASEFTPLGLELRDYLKAHP